VAVRRPVPLRTLKRYRAEIRALFRTRQATVRDADDLVGWLRDHVVATTRDIDDLAGGLEAQCRTLGLEPPSESRARRLARSAVHAYDEQFCARIHSHLPIVARERLDALLQASAVAPAVAPIVWLRNDPGRPSLNSLRAEMAKLGLLRGLELPADLFDRVLPGEIERGRQRVTVEAPHELRRHPEPARNTWLAAFAYLRTRAITDGLVDLLIETIHHIGARGISFARRRRAGRAIAPPCAR
jgi:hypothetical protein